MMDPLKLLKGFSRLEVATYSLDLGAAYWLASQGSGKGKHRATFVCDPAAFRPWFPRDGGHSLLRVRPCNTEALFHPKIWRVERGGKVSWLVGSANISIPESRSARNFMVLLEPGRKAGDALESLWQAVRQGRSSFILLDMKRESIEVLPTPLKTELIRRMKAVCRPQGRLLVASSAGISKALLDRLLKGGWARKIRLFVSREAARNLPRQPKGVQVEAFMPPSYAAPDLHGKLIFAQGPKEGLLYVGSANFTQKAYSGGNVESGVILQGRLIDLAGIVARLLAGRWRRAEWGSKRESEPQDEWAENGRMQRILSRGVRVDPKKKRIVIDVARLAKSLGSAKLLEVDLNRTSTQERLAMAGPRSGWTLPLHADVLDQELLFHLRGKGSHRLHLAALHYEDSEADVGKVPFSLSDLFQSSSGRIGDRRRNNTSRRTKRKVVIQEGKDVRFPWREVLPGLLRWSGNHGVESAQYVQSILGGLDKDPSSTLRAAIIREVVLAVGRNKGES